MLRIVWPSSFAALLVGSLIAAVQPGVAQRSLLPNLHPFPNASGILETFSTKGDLDVSGPFFQSLGTNGRACITCHLPDQGWTISAHGVQERFRTTNGLDPIFRTNDGSNCDHDVEVSTREGREHAYSLLISRGLIRIAIPVPAGAEFVDRWIDAQPVDPSDGEDDSLD